jgi:hypothetical protein
MKSLLTFIKIEWLFIRVMLAGIGKRNHNVFFWTYKKWTTGHTFRLVGPKVQEDKWSVLRYAKRSLSIFLHRTGGPAIDYSISDQDAVGIYAQWSEQKSDYGNYIAQVLKRPIKVYYWRDELGVEASFYLRSVMLLHLVAWAMILGCVSLASRRKGNWGLMLMQWLENHSIAQQLKHHHCSSVYMFGGYENDSPFTGLCFKTMGVQLILVPSPNPIRNFYQQTIAHGFVFTADFQRAEYERYRSEWQVDEIWNWPFPNYNKLTPYFKANDGIINGQGKLAFMSRGMWKRAEQGLHSQNDNKDLEYELNCMAALKSFLIQRKTLQLLICPHPIEKQNTIDWDKMKNYYTQYFEGVEVLFPENPEQNSYQLFNAAEVSVASVSSVNIERLFCGYKTLYAPIGADVVFFGQSTLDGVVARTEEELHALLSRAFSMSEDEFFKAFQLTAYHHDAFQSFL